MIKSQEGGQRSIRPKQIQAQQNNFMNNTSADKDVDNVSYES